MVDAFRSMGIEAVDTVGKPFNPALHEAIMREQNDDLPDGTVLMEFRKGFAIGDTLLRPAMVKVRLVLVARSSEENVFNVSVDVCARGSRRAAASIKLSSQDIRCIHAFCVSPVFSNGHCGFAGVLLGCRSPQRASAHCA